MKSTQSLAVLIPVGNANPDQVARTVEAARSLKPEGIFDRIEVLTLEQGGPADQRNAGVERASEMNSGWIFFVEPGETLQQQALLHLSGASDAYCALWGGHAYRTGTDEVALAPESLMSSSETVRNFHMALHWWIGKSHFVRTDVAQQIRFRGDAGPAWYADYLVRLWDAGRCLKSAFPLTCASEHQAGLGAEDKAFLIARLAESPRYFSFTYGVHGISFAYTGRNPTLERMQLRGLFYEQSDLETLASYVKPGLTYVDVGANTGNHSLYFAKVLEAKKVIPVEPNPDTIAVLKGVIEKNDLENVDMSLLGKGVGREAGTFEIKTGRRGYLGTAHLDASDTGSVQVDRLDRLIKEPIDVLKIDVEYMEIDVLEGARDLIETCKPLLFMEVQDENVASLLAILENLGYRIDHILPDQGYANYLAVPVVGKLG